MVHWSISIHVRGGLGEHDQAMKAPQKVSCITGEKHGTRKSDGGPEKRQATGKNARHPSRATKGSVLRMRGNQVGTKGSPWCGSVVEPKGKTKTMLGSASLRVVQFFVCPNEGGKAMAAKARNR
jgi:hypothetical protein